MPQVRVDSPTKATTESEGQAENGEELVETIALDKADRTSNDDGGASSRPSQKRKEVSIITPAEEEEQTDEELEASELDEQKQPTAASAA